METEKTLLNCDIVDDDRINHMIKYERKEYLGDLRREKQKI